jgi:hypothetical protein
VWFPFYGFRKEIVTFIMVKSKFLQDDRNVIQLDMKEFLTARACALLLPDAGPCPLLPWISSFQDMSTISLHLCFLKI